MIFRKSIFKALFRVGLLSLNPELVSSLRSKKPARYKDNPDAIYNDVLRKTYLLGTLITFVVYGVLLGMFPFQLIPGVMDIFLLFFLVFGFVQGFVLFYNTIYESRDLPVYLSLPVSSVELFFSRFAGAAIGEFQVIGPAWPIFTMFLMRHHFPIAWALPLGAFYTCGLWLVMLCLCLIFLLLMGKLSVLHRFRRGMINVLMILTQVGSVAVIIYAMRWISPEKITAKDTFVGPISSLLLMPLGWLYLMLLITAFAVLAGIWIYYSFAVRFEERLHVLQGAAQEQKRSKEHSYTKEARPQGLRRMFFRMNMGLVGDSTVFMASVVTPQIIPLFMIMPNLSSGNFGNLDEQMADPGFALVTAVLVGFIWAMLGGMTNTTLSAIAFSLDGETYEHLMALPYSKEAYFRQKWLFATVLMGVLPVLAMLGMMIYFKAIIYLPVAWFFFMVTHGVMTRFWLYFDLRHLQSEWHNVMELYSRVPRGRSMLLFFLGIFGATIYMVLIYLLGSMVSMWAALGVTVVIWLALILLLYWLPLHYRKKMVYPWGR